RVGLFASLHTRSGVLMKNRRQAHVHNGLAEFIQRSRYIVFVSLEIVRAALYAIWPNDNHLPLVFLNQPGPFERFGDGLFSLLRCEKIGSAVSRDERQVVLLEESADPAVRLHGFDLVASRKAIRSRLQQPRTLRASTWVCGPTSCRAAIP